MLCDSILDLIGHTPCVKLNHIDTKGAEIYVKLERFNPLGSSKDRAALYMIEEAEKRGDLVPGSTIIEPTSGNTGIALSYIAAVKGYRCLIFMPESRSRERRVMMEARGRVHRCRLHPRKPRPGACRRDRRGERRGGIRIYQTACKEGGHLLRNLVRSRACRRHQGRM